MKVKVLIADKFPDIYVEQLKSGDLEIIYEPKLGENDIPAAAENVDIIVVRSTIVNADAINKSKSLKLVIRAGAGTNNINIAAANTKGVYVANCPGMNSIAVAELAMGLIVSLDRRIPSNVMDFKNGVWNKGEYSKAEGLFGKNLGILGVGAIGKELAKRANSFGMNVYGRDIVKIDSPYITEEPDLQKILSNCDVISLHLPLNAATRGMFNNELFGYMKKGALLINTSRADVIDEDAMLEAIKEKGIRVAADVFKGEPEAKGGDVTSVLQSIPNVYITHHIGASTEQAQNAVAEETIRIVEEFVKSGSVMHWVNKAKKIDAKQQLVIKHNHKPGVLASVLDAICAAGVSVEAIDNSIFDGGHVACATLKVKEELSAETLAKISGAADILSVSQASL